MILYWVTKSPRLYVSFLYFFLLCLFFQLMDYLTIEWFKKTKEQCPSNVSLLKLASSTAWDLKWLTGKTMTAHWLLRNTKSLYFRLLIHCCVFTNNYIVQVAYTYCCLCTWLCCVFYKKRIIQRLPHKFCICNVLWSTSGTGHPVLVGKQVSLISCLIPRSL